jgi:hypothetical protein
MWSAIDMYMYVIFSVPFQCKKERQFMYREILLIFRVSIFAMENNKD